MYSLTLHILSSICFNHGHLFVRYCKLMQSMMTPQTTYLLVSMEYDPHRWQGEMDAKFSAGFYTILTERVLVYDLFFRYNCNHMWTWNSFIWYDAGPPHYIPEEELSSLFGKICFTLHPKFVYEVAKFCLIICTQRFDYVYIRRAVGGRRHI